MYEPAIELECDRLKNSVGAGGAVPRVVSLFAGCGGSSTGYRLAGCQVRAALEPSHPQPFTTGIMLREALQTLAPTEQQALLYANWG